MNGDNKHGCNSAPRFDSSQFHVLIRGRVETMLPIAAMRVTSVGSACGSGRHTLAFNYHIVPDFDRNPSRTRRPRYCETVLSIPGGRPVIRHSSIRATGNVIAPIATS